MNKIDIENFGDFRLGLTGNEVKVYLHLRAPRRNLKKLCQDFYQTAGVNTGACTLGGETLMYRHDVLRFADKILLQRGTYFD